MVADDAVRIDDLARMLDLHPEIARRLVFVLGGDEAQRVALIEAIRLHSSRSASYTATCAPREPLLRAARRVWRKNYGLVTPAASRVLVQRAVQAMHYDGQPDFSEAKFRETFGCDTVEESFRQAVRPWEGALEFAEVANVKFGAMSAPLRRSDTPRDLYRLLYLLCPVGVRFNDMYGGGIEGITSPCRRFAASFYFHKYELAAHLLVVPRLAMRWRAALVESSIAGSGGMQTKSPDALAWFEMIDLALTRKWRVYPSNKFEV